MPGRPSYEVIEDRYLVAASLAGKSEAYDELVRRYRGAVILLAWKTLGSRDTAQDVAQEAFVVAFQQLGQLKDARHFGPWIRVIAHNLAKAVARRESRTLPVESVRMDLLLETHGRERTASPVDALLKKERDAAIRELMAALPEPVQIVLQLYYGEQWSVAQIAEFLSLTKTTVKWRLHAGRKQVSNALSEMAAVDENGSEVSTVPDTQYVTRNHCRRGRENYGQDQEEGDQADPPHARRDRLACGGRGARGRPAERGAAL